MGKLKYNMTVMKFMSLFESLTGAALKDCISNDAVIFVVQENDMGRAIGKHGSNVKKLERILRRKIKLVEFSSDMAQFIQNFLYPLQTLGITNEDGVITIKGPDTKTRGLIIGRDSRNLKHLKEVVSRYFQIKEIKVV